MKKRPVLLLCLLLTSFLSSNAQTNLRQNIQRIANKIDGTVGVSVLNIDTRDTLSYNGDAHMVMHSVLKFPLAVAVLHKVDKGSLKLDEAIHISKYDLSNLYSPMRDKYPDGNISLPLSELLSYTVSLSDNDACDRLIKLLGGVKNVEDYIHSLGVKGFSLKSTEKQQMAADWNIQYTNWCTPKAITQLLEILDKGSALSKTSNSFLWKIMLETSTGPKRLKGLLPAGTQIAHKTGTSPVNEKGLAPATNDAGTIILPNGKHVILSVFITDSTAPEAKRERVIAEIAKAVCDSYSK